MNLTLLKRDQPVSYSYTNKNLTQHLVQISVSFTPGAVLFFSLLFYFPLFVV